jgi:hypothetical protein
MTIRVFIGASANGEDAESCMVLEHSIRSRCSKPVEITWMMQSHDPASFWAGFETARWATPFSGFRWAVPAACGFEGRAIYLDSDMLVLADLAELWTTPIAPGKIVAARNEGRLCASLWDCAAAQGRLLSLADLKRADGHSRMAALLRAHPEWVQPFTANWNYLDTEDRGPLSEAKILHMTDMTSQCHLRYALPRLAAAGQRHWFDGQVRPHPRAEITTLFEAEYAAAMASGYAVESYVPAVPFGSYAKRSLAGYRGRA